MPVPTEVTVRCSECRTLKGELNRWLLWAVDGREFHFDLYDADMLPHYDGALCGKECLQKRVEKHADQLMAAHPAGRKK